MQEKWSALGTLRSYVDTVPLRGVFGAFIPCCPFVSSLVRGHVKMTL